MSQPNPYSILFEPVKIGPVTARNRFFQVPHCNGLGHLRPQAEAAMREMKAEGGWSVVSTQEVEIHPSSDLSPFSEHRLWDDRDIPAMRLLTDGVHDKGALAAVELAHNGSHSANHLTRAPLLGPSETICDEIVPKQARAMDKSDIRAYRRWHRAAARRAKQAGFDIVYVYAGHRMSLAHHFLVPEMNQRLDEYGGCLENRVRLTRELLEDTIEEVGDSCAVAFRFAVDEVMGQNGMQAHEEGRAVVEMLAEMPDLWDVNLSGWDNDSATSRFQPNEGYQTPFVDFVKSLTTKPVVAVGRLTSPDLMVSMVKKGIVDFIGAARPSIADPFLPAKIRDGRIEDIRECIGCNICVMSDNQSIPIRCTQNPTMGEEWRRGWHPEKIAPKGHESDALVVGAGPAGLECALQLARRGYQVTLAEGSARLGGRVLMESEQPGLGAWRRVADNRIYDLERRANVAIYRESLLDAQNVLDLGIRNVFLATGAQWRRDGVGRSSRRALPSDDSITIHAPEEIMTNAAPLTGPVVIFDDDQTYLASVLAEKLAKTGQDVHFVTPGGVVSSWSDLTLEQHRIQARLLALGVHIVTSHRALALSDGQAILGCIYSDRRVSIPCAAFVPVTERTRQTGLFDDLRAFAEKGKSDLNTLELIGDALMPGLIADSVYSGHLAARSFECDPEEVNRALFRREMPSLQD